MESENDRVGHCANCNIYGPMFLCANCKGVLYCSRYCQKADWKQHKVVCNISTTFSQESHSSSNHDQAAYGICVFCQRVGAHRCAKCKSTWYCTRVCQAADWKRHKPECKRKKTNQQLTDLKPVKDVAIPSMDTLSIGDPKSIDDPKKYLMNPVNVDTLFAREYGKEDRSVLVNDTESTETDSNPTATFGSEISSDTKTRIAEDKKSNVNSGLAMGGVKEKRTRTAEMKKEPKENKCDGNSDKAKETKDSQSANCNRCNIMGCTQKCARCRSVFYCSKACQREDWTAHKKSCKREYTEEEKQIIEERLRRKKEQVVDLQKMEKDHWITFDNFAGGNKRFLQTLSPEKALMTATRPPGSLRKAIQLAKDWFPGFEVLTQFVNVPREPRFPWEMFMMESLNIHKYVIVAFMYRYHEHVMRHGAYLKDDIESESKVEFYLDQFGDNPAPFFTYSMVKPGNYICLVKPLVHAFMDGTIGFRIEDPASVCIIEKDMLSVDSPWLNSRGGNM